MGLRHLPQGHAEQLESLISCHPGQVSSKGLSTSDAVDMTLLAFDGGESVSEEAYEGDTLYYLIAGAARIVYSDASAPDAPMTAGDIIMVPQGVLHAIEADDAFKVLQITVR